jgi:hypothetical protein
MTNKECPECNGWGYTEYDRDVPCSSGRGYVEEVIADCENCGGSGTIEYTEEDEIDDFLLGEPNPGPVAIIFLILGVATSFLVLAFLIVRELL